MKTLTITAGASRHKQIQARDDEMVKLYNETLLLMVRHGVDAPRSEAVKFVVANGSPRYHVSYKCAYENVRKRLSKGKMPIAFSPQECMWNEMALRVKQLTACGISIAAAVDFVLRHCRATRYFIDPVSLNARIGPARRRRAQALMQPYQKSTNNTNH
ncbi:MAG: hypothetical protein IJ808_03100 [Muribaculaceae bacterium]|nr:hypothetical protein [Muribaculaceae bacterium]